MSSRKIISSAPGRVCLFGEHQDYLHLPVIPCAIDLRVSIAGETTDNGIAKLNLPDINSYEELNILQEQNYSVERDYYKSVINVLMKNGFTFSQGIKGEVKGKIPINSGTSSSSALIVAWINFLTQLSDQNRILDKAAVADLAFQAEVAEFNEPGGKMDHYSCSLGGMIYLDFEPELSFKEYKTEIGTMVLGDSGEPKDTKEILSRVKNGVLSILDKLNKEDSDFSLRKTEIEELDKYEAILSDDEIDLLKSTIINYNITLNADKYLSAEKIDDVKIGDLLNEHHHILNSKLRISTPKIERMLKAALDAGAYGGKINGSGGGGCMFAYAPQNPEKVAEAIEAQGGKAYIVNPGEGVL